MIWEALNYNKTKAKEKFRELESAGYSTIHKPKHNKEFLTLYNDIDSIFNAVFDKYHLDEYEKQGYLLDLNFGLELYVLLNNKYNFKVRDASNDNIWRWLQLEIIPHFVHLRWNGYHEDRFVENSRRLWLKQIWWYIHLSWQGDTQKTHEILKDNTADTILNLVERPGIGYNVELFREIMKQYATHNDKSNDSRQLFRQVMVLNNARIHNTVKNLVDGSYEQYVKKLFQDLLL